VVFGWVFASHQVGSAIAAWGGGVIRDVTGSYDPAWYAAGALCVLASALSISIRLRPEGTAPGFSALPPAPAAEPATL
jgi:predicted MFS family arabinose efflux permease